MTEVFEIPEAGIPRGQFVFCRTLEDAQEAARDMGYSAVWRIEVDETRGFPIPGRLVQVYAYHPGRGWFAVEMSGRCTCGCGVVH